MSPSAPTTIGSIRISGITLGAPFPLLPITSGSNDTVASQKNRNHRGLVADLDASLAKPQALAPLSLDILSVSTAVEGVTTGHLIKLVRLQVTVAMDNFFFKNAIEVRSAMTVGATTSASSRTAGLKFGVTQDIHCCV